MTLAQRVSPRATGRHLQWVSRQWRRARRVSDHPVGGRFQRRLCHRRRSVQRPASPFHLSPLVRSVKILVFQRFFSAGSVRASSSIGITRIHPWPAMPFTEDSKKKPKKNITAVFLGNARRRASLERMCVGSSAERPARRPPPWFVFDPPRHRSRWPVEATCSTRRRSVTSPPPPGTSPASAAAPPGSPPDPTWARRRRSPRVPRWDRCVLHGSPLRLSHDPPNGGRRTAVFVCGTTHSCPPSLPPTR